MRTKSASVGLLTLFAAAFALGACGDGGDDGFSPDILVTDTAAPPDDLTVAFGGVLQGTAAYHLVAAANVGDAPLGIGRIGSLPAPFSLTSDACSGSVLEAGEGCAIMVRFSPTNWDQPFSESFEISSTDLDEPVVVVTVSGVGEPPI